MDRNLAPAHAAHDELLLARLFGGDLDSSERERALEVTASCEKCADVLAAFEAIAAATVALPVPRRPRAFTLSEAQAATLRRRGLPRSLPGLRGAISSLGPVRSLGASMVAVGVAGILAVGLFSTLGRPGPAGPLFDQAAAPVTESDSGSRESTTVAGPSGKNGDGLASPTGGSYTAQQSERAPAEAGRTPRTAMGSPAVSSAPSGEVALDGQSPATGGSGGAGGPPPSPKGGSDSMPIWVIGLAGLAAAGLVLLTVPSVRRLSHHRRR